MRELLRYVRSSTILNGSGYKTKRGPNGTTLEIRGGGPKPSNTLPWTFSAYEDPDTGLLVGGWTNCILQLGYNTYMTSEDVTYVDDDRKGYVKTIGGTDRTDDGSYWVEVDLKNETATIKLEDEIENKPIDLERNRVSVWIGEVKDGKQTHGLHINPVIYKYV